MLNTRVDRTQLNVRKMVVIAMLSGISIFLGLTGLGFVQLPLFKLTILHIPVIIGAIIEGPIVGASIGLIFGLFSLYQNITAPNLMSPFFYNPIVSIVPRVLIGIVAYYVYKLLKEKFKTTKTAITIASIAGSLTNTVGVLGSIYLFYFKAYADILLSNGTVTETSRKSITIALLTIFSTNGLAEATLSALISAPIVIAIFKLQKRKK